MSAGKPTPGRWGAWSDETSCVRHEDGGLIAQCTHLRGPHGAGGRRDAAEVAANARLIAEAGSVYNETGLTPRQLAEQRAELLAACKALLAEADHTLPRDWHVPLPVSTAKAAIARAEGKP